MTQINTTEYAKLTTLDQGIMWAIVSLHAANTDYRNNNYDQNAAVRQGTAATLCNWEVSQDDNGVGRFGFSFVAPLVDRNPFAADADVLERVKSYSVFLLEDMPTDEPLTAKGLPLPELPEWITTMEQLLAYLCRIAATVSHAIATVNRVLEAIDTNKDDDTFPEIGDFCVPIDTTAAIPAIDTSQIVEFLGWELRTEFRPGTSEGIIAQYARPISTLQLLEGGLEYLVTQVFAADSAGISPSSNIDTSGGYQEKGIETLPICSEQDPNILTVTDGDVLNLINKPA